jgi:hypothetical protein
MGEEENEEVTLFMAWSHLMLHYCYSRPFELWYNPGIDGTTVLGQ